MEKRKELLENYFEEVIEKTGEILEEAKNTNDRKKIQEIIPAWSTLNRLHATISSLLAFHR